MNEIPFEERQSYNGRRVRVIYDGIPPYWSGYARCVGKTGTIVERSRLPWVDRQKSPYTTLPVLMDEPNGSLTNISYCGVEHLELIDVELD